MLLAYLRPSEITGLGSALFYYMNSKDVAKTCIKWMQVLQFFFPVWASHPERIANDHCYLSVYKFGSTKGI